MSEEDRLCMLQVGKTGHQQIRIGRREIQQRTLDGCELLHCGEQCFPGEHAQVQGYLVIPTAGGVEPSGGLADQLDEATLDARVNVLPGRGEIKLTSRELVSYSAQAAQDCRRVVL